MDTPYYDPFVAHLGSKVQGVAELRRRTTKTDNIAVGGKANKLIIGVKKAGPKFYLVSGVFETCRYIPDPQGFPSVCP